MRSKNWSTDNSGVIASLFFAFIGALFWGISGFLIAVNYLYLHDVTLILTPLIGVLIGVIGGLVEESRGFIIMCLGIIVALIMAAITLFSMFS